MNKLAKISDLFGRYIAVIVLVTSVIALFYPGTANWIDLSWINYFLMVIMFGMGLTIKPSDFKVVFTHPKEIIIGCVAQFTIMPILAYLLSKAFGVEVGLMTGIILVGTCPGGTASNVITYISKGDTALSVGMTALSTLLAPILTPAITYLLLNQTVKVDMLAMFISIVEVVMLPLALGFVLDRFFSKYTRKIAGVLPMVSVIAIATIVSGIISHNSSKILSTGMIVFAVVILHNLFGVLLGFGAGLAMGLPMSKIKAISIEVGMQNSGLATSLASTSFPNLAMATVPGAIFSVWHNLSGAVIASIYRRLGNDKDSSQKES